MLNFLNNTFLNSLRFSIFILATQIYGKVAAVENIEITQKLAAEIRWLQAEAIDVEIISASRKAEKLSEAPASAIVITAKQIKERGYEDIFDIIRDIPGFDLVHTNGTYTTVFAQRGNYSGAENSKTLVMIDGIIDNNLVMATK